jgi:DNA-binding transcriptional LysR family regulator
MSDLVELKKLKNLIAVAEAGNISVAAKRLYLSQPSLSIQIKDLEDVMQVPLLVRDHKGVRATPAAEILITGGRELLRMRDEMIGMARALHRVTFVPMRLGFSSFVDHALYEMVCSIHTSLFPSCEIKPKSGDPVDLLPMLERGEIDAALVTLPASGAGLKAYPFTQSRLVVCMKSDDPLAKLKEITPADLGSKLTIFRDPRQHPEAHDRLIEMLDVVGITGDVANTNKTPHDLQWMVESGTGYALIREGSELQPGLVTRPVAGVTWTVDSALIVAKSTSQRTMPHLVREMRKRLRLQSSLPQSKKPVRSVRPRIGDRILPLFG